MQMPSSKRLILTSISIVIGAILGAFVGAGVWVLELMGAALSVQLGSYPREAPSVLPPILVGAVIGGFVGLLGLVGGTIGTLVGATAVFIFPIGGNLVPVKLIGASVGVVADIVLRIVSWRALCGRT